MWIIPLRSTNLVPIYIIAQKGVKVHMYDLHLTVYDKRPKYPYLKAKIKNISQIYNFKLLISNQEFNYQFLILKH